MHISLFLVFRIVIGILHTVEGYLRNLGLTPPPHIDIEAFHIFVGDLIVGDKCIAQY